MRQQQPVKEFWSAVDNIDGPFCFNEWEGYILTFVQKQSFQYKSIYNNPQSGFDTLKPTKLQKKFVDLSPHLNKRVVDDPSYFFGYSTDEMNNLFPPHRSPTDHICSSIKDVLELNQSKANSFDDENVNICVASFIPDSFGNNKSILELGSNILSFNTSHYSN